MRACACVSDCLWFGNRPPKATKPTLNYKNALLTNSSKTTEALNEHFRQTAVNLTRALLTTNDDAINFMQGDYQNSMFISPITSGDKINTIKSLKNKNTKVDEITVNVIKHNVEQIAYPISLLFNQSISDGKFPSIL